MRRGNLGIPIFLLFMVALILVSVRTSAETRVIELAVRGGTPMLMRVRKSLGMALAVVTSVFLLGSSAATQMQMAEEKPSIRILSPEKGQTSAGSRVVVRLEVKGLVLKHAGEHVMGTGHVHLFLDKIPDMFSELPRGVPGVWHGAETTFTLKDVPPGLHILTAVLGTGMHGWVRPPAVDSIHFFVVPERQ